MKCTNCGNEFEGNFCPSCGQSVKQLDPQLQTVPAQSYQQPYTQPQTLLAQPNQPYAQSTIIINNTNTNTNRNVNQVGGGYDTASHKSKLVTLVLCILFGVLGVHRFYVGKVGSGLIYLFTGGFFMIGWILDILKILSGTFTDGSGRPICK